MTSSCSGNCRVEFPPARITTDCYGWKNILTNMGSSNTIFHYDVIKWKHFPFYWPFVRGIHRWPVNSPHRPVTQSFDVFFGQLLDTRLRKRWWCWWFETPSRPLWRHCNVQTKTTPILQRFNCKAGIGYPICFTLQKIFGWYVVLT